MAWTKWQNWVALVAGLVLIFAHNSFGSFSTGATWTGIGIALVAVWALAMPLLAVAEWANVLLGLGLFIAPWTAHFSGSSGPAWTAWILGAVTVIASLWALPRAGSTGVQRSA